MAQLKVFSISELVDRLSKVAEVNRYDQVSRNVHAIFESKMKNNPDAVVNSSDLKGVYSTFAGMNPQSDFRNYFDDVFKTETAEAKPNEMVFGRDNSFSADIRPSVVEIPVDMDATIRDASLVEIKNVVAGIVENPQYKFQGFSKVANVGGFANWKVSFETGHGIAEIGVPVIITDEAAYAPNKFSSATGSHDFNKETLKDFSRSYIGDRAVAAGKSSIQSLGTLSIIPTEQFVDDVDSSEPLNISLAMDMTPIDESLTASVDGMDKSTFAAIEGARQAVMSKLSLDASGNKKTSNLQLAYAGAVRFEDMPNDTETFNGVIAFNASRKNRFGSNNVTIPVEVRGQLQVANTFMDSSQNPHELNATTVDLALGASDAVEIESFSDAFLASVASYSELSREMKESIYNGNMKRANSVIKAITNRFEDSVVKNAMNDYIEYVKDAAEKKAGPRIEKDWHTEMDDSYTGTINSSSVFIN